MAALPAVICGRRPKPSPLEFWFEALLEWLVLSSHPLSLAALDFLLVKTLALEAIVRYNKPGIPE